ncbi:MAG TPA: transcriptional repressor [Fimbriimonadaceae bacterium]|nr:transcriptional repressor [Fimbriimonadaceae bacterium]HRJ96184.1 transcriptional repressor [Fimbriimonadaceae bacterium]
MKSTLSGMRRKVSDREATEFEERSLALLKREGFRITMPRVQVIRTLAQSHTPLTAYGIHEQIVSTGGRIDVVSVYRILETLTRIGLVHHICHIGLVDGYLACQLGSEHLSESQHLYCTKCEAVREVETPAEVLRAIRRQLKDLAFEPTSIKIEIIGTWIEPNGK